MNSYGDKAPLNFESAETRAVWIVDHADHFTAVAFLGTGKYGRHEIKTLDEAIKLAEQKATASGRTYMIYAVSGVHDTWVKNIHAKRENPKQGK